MHHAREIDSVKLPVRASKKLGLRGGYVELKEIML